MTNEPNDKAQAVDVLDTMRRSHNTARMTAEEHPNSAILAKHSENTALATEAVAALIAERDALLAVAKTVRSTIQHIRGPEVTIHTLTNDLDAAIALCKDGAP